MVKRDLFNRVNEGTSIATDFPRHLFLSLFSLLIYLLLNCIGVIRFCSSIDDGPWSSHHWKSVAKRIGIEKRFFSRFVMYYDKCINIFIKKCTYFFFFLKLKNFKKHDLTIRLKFKRIYVT